MPHIDEKIKKQMTERNWTETEIQETVANPHRTARSIDRTRYTDGSGDPATAYFDDDDNYVVVNNDTGQVVQVSDKTDPDWQIPDYFVFENEWR
jgi:hypothetical protein